MNILSLNTGHDASVTLFEDFNPVFTCKEERLIRQKAWGLDIPWLSLDQAFKKISPQQIDALVLLRGAFPFSLYKTMEHRSLLQRLRYNVRSHLFMQPLNLRLDMEMPNSGKGETDLLDLNKVRALLGLRSNCEIIFSNHHFSHALPTIFFSPHWDHGLTYTADGVGDGIYYSIYSFDSHGLNEVYGGDTHIFSKNKTASSLGRLYSAVTVTCGYQPNRHEGKITGLAAYGKPVFLDELRKHFYLNSCGMVESTFQKHAQVVDFISQAANNISKEDLACSVQLHLQETMLAATAFHRQSTQSSVIGLSGGVFANVRVNQVIAESEGVKEIFVFPAMGDEGLTMGAGLDYCLKKWGWKEFMRQRRDLGTIYYGKEFSDKEIIDAADGFRVHPSKNIASEAAAIIHEGKIGAIFTKGMEYGPRALGSRSILATPKDKSINKTLNDRLNRTEFMPFAPVVRAERLKEIFKCPEASVRATQYMTVTCQVNPQWEEKIPAVVHIDGTARPQSIQRQDNPLYYDILHQFENISGLPCLINTSFNAHEEPIINTPQEALLALKQGRIDFLITDSMMIFSTS